ncbi:hydantoinase/oxoprolinase N-terminal domain-containing protein [Inquilinus limosus]|uniref:hydantoinase/oxoprolinase N-terminal domain-containing protein n=1 Tax=Inquilinus limosus TaxID=171674 RepID=UPI00068DDB57|nr:hydantoinase/oxoprolinase N-terminal domain-containing protein [Inquilinus limosus]
MSLSLGIDTGGTFTDAVLFDPDRGVVAAAKRLTTKHDLALGIGAAIDAVLQQHPAEIGFVGLSTTLATNAVVEGQGNPACLILIGYPEAALDRAGLRAAIGGDPVAAVAGGHRPTGEEQAPLDLEAVRAAILQHAPAVTAFAVAGYFAVRNPAHELAVRDLVRDLTGRPVTCGHELTSGLDAPRRALTALLNARLIPLTASLIRAVRGRLDARGIAAPLMVVKGDGSLIADRFALARRSRPYCPAPPPASSARAG